MTYVDLKLKYNKNASKLDKPYSLLELSDEEATMLTAPELAHAVVGFA